MKKTICLLISFALVFSLCGCGDTTPLKEKLIVQGIAVDVEEDSFLVTLQIYSPSSDSTDQSKNQLLEAKATTVYEALQLVDENTGKQSYYSDAKVIAFSYESLQKGIWNNLEFFIRSSEIGSNVCLAATMGKASDLFLIESEGVNMPSKVLSNALHYGKTDARPISGELMAVTAKLMTESADIALPIVATTKKDDKTYPVLNGVLCFQDDKPCFAMNEQQKWAYNWIHGYHDDRAFVISFAERFYSLQFQKTDTDFHAEIVNGHPHFTLEIQVICDVMETASPQGIEISQMEEFRNCVQQEIEMITLYTLENVFTQQKCDVFDLGRTLKKQQPDYYKSLENWRQEMAHCTFDCTAKVTIARAGQGTIEP